MSISTIPNEKTTRDIVSQNPSLAAKGVSHIQLGTRLPCHQDDVLTIYGCPMQVDIILLAEISSSESSFTLLMFLFKLLSVTIGYFGPFNKHASNI